MGAVQARDYGHSQRGQGLVEFAMLVPVFLLLLLGMLEFGLVFDQRLTLQYATREGARVGAALGNDGGSGVCNAATTTVDDQIVAAVQRVILSPGSRVEPVAGTTQVQIWKANPGSSPPGLPTAGLINTWTYMGPNTGPTVDGQSISFTEGAHPWSPCSRVNSALAPSSPNSIGVSMTYTYVFQTPLAGILRFFGGASAGSLTISDKTVMALNPSD